MGTFLKYIKKMFVPFLLFGMLVLVTDDSQTIQIASPSSEYVVLHNRRESCKTECAKKCLSGLVRQCIRCWSK